MSNQWDLYVTDRVGVRQAALDIYESAELFARINDVTTWEVVLPTETEAGQRIISDSLARIEVVIDNAVWRSGPVSRVKRDVEVDGDMLTVSGVDDTVWLARRNAHPQPGTPVPPYNASAYDVHTDRVSVVLAELVNVNAGPAAVSTRQVPGFTVPVPAAAGPVITVNARWQNLLTLCQDMARPYGIIFDVVDLTFSARMPVDNGVVFSAGLETLAGWSSTTDVATANMVVVAGQGEEAARLIREQSDATSVASWGRVESFVDQRQTSDVAELDKAATEALASGVKPVTVAFTPLDVEGQAFAVDWWLGDTVTVEVGGLTVIDQIREIHVTLDDTGATIVPSVGAPSGDLSLFRALSGLERRTRQLERI